MRAAHCRGTLDRDTLTLRMAEAVRKKTDDARDLRTGLPVCADAWRPAWPRTSPASCRAGAAPRQGRQATRCSDRCASTAWFASQPSGNFTSVPSWTGSVDG
ncbi:hypothetical protein RKD44_004867 [Streptomyces collinus]